MIKTFNDLVNECIEESNRVDFKSQIISLSFSILNKLHSIGEWRRDYEEAEFFREGLSNPYDKDFSFKIPPRFRRVRALVAVTSEQIDAYLPEIYPSKGARDNLEFYYQYKDNILCYHYTGIGKIKLAYYKKCPNFIYYENGNQPPAEFNNQLNRWSFLSNGKYIDSLGDPVVEEEAINSVSDWILTDYFEMVKAGVLNRIFSTLGDDRYKIAYSTYQDSFNSVFVPNESMLGTYGITK